MMIQNFLGGGKGVRLVLSQVELISSECCEIKTKVIPAASLPWRANKELKVRASNCRQSSRFACDWLREWHEFSGPITEQSKALILIRDIL